MILNPFGVLTDRQGFEDMESFGFNPLLTLDPSSRDFNSDASYLAEAMIVVQGSQPIFDESARALLAAIIMYVVMKAHETRRVPTMGEVRQLLCLPSKDPNRFDPTDEGEGIPKLAREMMRSTNAGLRNKASQFTEWNREIQGVVSSAKIQTECFDDPPIAEDLAKRGFDFRELKRKPTTVYLILPPVMMERQSKWLRLVLTSALQASMRQRQAGEPRILFMMDEFAALGHLKIIEDNLGLGARLRDSDDAGVAGSEPAQEPLQGKVGDVPGQRRRDCLLRAERQTTAEWLSKRLGDTTRIARSESRRDDRSASDNNANYSPVKVPFMTPHELYGLEPGHMVLLMAGLSNATRIYVPPYFRVTERDRRARVNPYFHPVPRRRNLPPPANNSGGTWATSGVTTVDIFRQVFGSAGQK